MGGRSLYTIPWISWIYLILGKKTHFQGYRRGDHGGADGGVFKWGGGWGGDFRHTWWGAGGALGTHMKHFLPKKTRFFYFRVCLSMKSRRPPSAPPWIDFRNIKIWYVTINQNKKSLIFDHYSCFYNFKHAHMRFLAIFGIWSSSEELEKFCRNAKNRWFLALRSTISSEGKTCDTNVIFLMSNRYSFELMKIVSYNMEGRMGGRHGT